MSAGSVTPLAPADRERWAALWTGYLAFYETALPDAVYASTWSRISAPDGDLRAFGARDASGTLVGIAHYLYHPHAWSTRESCYLQDLFVDASARGAGHGRRLIQAVAAVARERPCHAFYWQTRESNAVARRLYDTVARWDGSIVYDYPL